MPVIMKREKRLIPTYVPAAPNELPFFLEKRPTRAQRARSIPSRIPTGSAMRPSKSPTTW